MRITLIIRSIRGGGAERVCVHLANGFADQGHTVSVITLTPPAPDDYQLSSAVVRHAFDLLPERTPHGSTPLDRNWRILKTLRDTCRQNNPEVAISFVHMVNIRAILALRGTGIPVVITEHNDPSHSKMPWPFGALRRVVYPMATRLVTVGAGVDAGFRWFPARRRQVIYNPIPQAPHPTPNHPKSDSNPATIVAMGRLTRQKGFDLLIQAFSRLHPRHPNWRLLILGEGPDRPALEQQIAELGLQRVVTLLGFVSDPLPHLLSSQIYAMSSRWEGFPMALGEAMAAGLPVVSFNCKSGPSEYITSEDNGVLVPPEDVAALSDALERLMQDENLRVNLSKRAKESLDRFALAPILGEWEGLFCSIAPPDARSE